MSLLKRLAILHQVGAIAILALIGFVVVGAAYFGGNLIEASFRKEAERRSTEFEIATDVKTNFLQARRREKDFLIRMDMKYADDLFNVTAAAKRDLSALVEIETNPTVLAEIDTVAGKLTAYERQFADIVRDWQTIGLDEKSGLLGTLRASVHNVEQMLGGLDNAPLTVKMLMMRRHEKDFMMRLAPKYVGDIADRQAEFLDLLAYQLISAADKNEISGLLAAYVTDFNKVAELRLQLVEETKVLSQLFSEAEEPLLQFIEHVTTQKDQARAEAARISALSQNAIIATMILAVLIVITLSFIIARGITTPIQRMTHAMTALAEGNKETEVPATDYQNEVGKMAVALETFKIAMIESERLAAEQAELQQRAAEQQANAAQAQAKAAEEREVAARKDAEAQAEQAKRAVQLRELTELFEEKIGAVLETVAAAANELEGTATSMSSIASQSSEQSRTVAIASKEASGNVSTVAAAAEELSASIEEISKHVTQSMTAVRNANRTAEVADQRISTLGAASSRIGDIVDVINEIAERTNLLSLNATIEAQRAGEAGKGFAVVANEVKDLARQTSQATDEVTKQISDIQEASEGTAQALADIKLAVSEVTEITTAIAAAIEEQSSATQEIARNIEQAANGTQMVASNIIDVEKAANDTGASANDVLQSSKELNLQSVKIHDFVNEFLTNVKVA